METVLFREATFEAGKVVLNYAEGPMPGDCPVFPADNPWNTDISGYPVDPNSDDYIASIN